LVRGDFYNPFSQFIVKATNPMLRPLRRLVPSIAGMDTASLVLILLLQMFDVVILGLLQKHVLITPVPLLVLSVLVLVQAALRFYMVGIFVYVVLGWVAPGNYSPGNVLIQQIFEPAIAPFRRLLPSGSGLDFSPMVAGIVLYIFGIVLINVMVMAQPLLGSPWYDFLGDLLGSHGG
jgi:YggT family protein